MLCAQRRFIDIKCAKTVSTGEQGSSLKQFMDIKQE